MISNKTSVMKNICVRRISRTGALAFLLLVFAAAPAIPFAQEQQPAQPKHKQSDNSRGPGFARQLTHETREAAGEEKDETAEFKQSSSVQFIARVTGLSIPHAYMFCVFLNFAVVALAIIWAAAKYLPRIFSARTAAIQKAMQEAQKASEEARRKLTEIEFRLMKLDVEIATMRDAAEKEAAEDDKRKIIESAQQEIASAVKAARRELTAYAANLAVGLAKKQIRVDAATDQALVRNFADQVGSYSGASNDAGKGRG
jgi:F-type H+-transporting ATPase subunit b